MNATKFALAIQKERSRSDRRDLCFSIVRFDVKDTDFAVAAKSSSPDALISAFRNRLRITDEIGYYENQLAVLLPETYPSQAALVANDLTEIAAGLGIDATTDIVAYPEIDSSSPSDGSSHSGSQFSRNDQNHPPEDNKPSKAHAAGASAKDGNGEPFASSSFEASGGVATLEPVKAQALQTKQKPSRPASLPKISRLPTAVPTPKLKRAIDIFGASLGLIALSPVFAAAVISIRCSSKGPAFFLQWREGKDGQLFKIYKFRTMRLGADEEKDAFRAQSEQDGPAFKIKDDPRITGVGKYLRKSCVDELPQLINVLKGEMSLVGPRPLPVDESLNCNQWHRRRLDVLPGMTCIWQVDGGRDIPFDEWMRMDMEYIDQRSFFTDIRLIVKTAVVTLLHRGSV